MSDLFGTRENIRETLSCSAQLGTGFHWGSCIAYVSYYGNGTPLGTRRAQRTKTYHACLVVRTSKVGGAGDFPTFAQLAKERDEGTAY